MSEARQDDYGVVALTYTAHATLLRSCNTRANRTLLLETDQLPQARTPGVTHQTLVTAREALHNKPPPPSTSRHPGAGCLLTDNHDCRTASCATTAELIPPHIAQGRATPAGGSIYRTLPGPLGRWKH